MKKTVLLIGGALAAFGAGDSVAAVTNVFCRPGGWYCVCDFESPNTRADGDVDWMSPKPIPGSNANGSLNSCVVSSDTGETFWLQPRYGTEQEGYWKVPKPNPPNNAAPDCWPKYFDPICMTSTTSDSYPQESGSHLGPDFTTGDVYPYPETSSSPTIPPFIRFPEDVPVPVPPSWPGSVLPDDSPTPFPTPTGSPLPWPSGVDTWEELRAWLSSMLPNPNPTTSPSPSPSPSN